MFERTILLSDRLRYLLGYLSHLFERLSSWTRFAEIDVVDVSTGSIGEDAHKLRLIRGNLCC